MNLVTLVSTLKLPGQISLYAGVDLLAIVQNLKEKFNDLRAGTEGRRRTFHLIMLQCVGRDRGIARVHDDILNRFHGNEVLEEDRLKALRFGVAIVRDDHDVHLHVLPFTYRVARFSDFVLFAILSKSGHCLTLGADIDQFGLEYVINVLQNAFHLRTNSVTKFEKEVKPI